MNKVLLVGRIANDVRSFKTPSGVAYARTTVAVNRRGTDSTDFIPIVAWRATADFLVNYASKGSLVSIEGQFTVNQYNAADGSGPVRSYEVTVDNLNMLESRSVREQRQTANVNAVNTNAYNAYNQNAFNAYNKAAQPQGYQQLANAAPVFTGTENQNMQQVNNPFTIPSSNNNPEVANQDLGFVLPPDDMD